MPFLEWKWGETNIKLNDILKKIHKNSRSWKKNPLTKKIVFKVTIRTNPWSLIRKGHFSHHHLKENRYWRLAWKKNEGRNLHLKRNQIRRTCLWSLNQGRRNTLLELEVHPLEALTQEQWKKKKMEEKRRDEEDLRRENDGDEL